MQGTAPHSFSVQAFNQATFDQATAMMERIVERSTWFARRAAEARPFGTVDELAAWLDNEVRDLKKDEALQLLCAHPELSPPDPTSMTLASQMEQGRLELLDLDRETAAALADINQRYAQRHGYPLIVALHEHTEFGAILDQFDLRISAAPEEELRRSLGQVVSVMKARLSRLTDKTSNPQEAFQVEVTSANVGGPKR
ncbi:2-oxo-4-hydroxy-4-carboxy-5-ureidoimidazoline decarboxylase [Ruegeria sp. HKCCA6707]|uniref:2-oxo-4-hydroxy-4-carboxy-5-ureidoimidazoline decarboxylase n=1 Tax=Ruegeria sp. HKCCA6707 TaxID=2682996 RepID=UPI0014889EAA|nr:2-oxo-4-hydroxy-4-carboxy-5-ureidoimidazoline decarboxylase [Ruegeria sp. HKCCA6707]